MLEEINKKRQRMDNIWGVGFFIFVPLLTVVLAMAVTAVQHWYLRSNFENAEYIGVSASISFYIPAVLIAWIIFVIAANAAIPEVTMEIPDVKPDPEEMRKSKRAGKVLGFFLSLAGISGLILAVFNYCIATDDYLVFNDFFVLKEHRYKYEDIDKVQQVRRYEKLISGRDQYVGDHFRVIMKDGFQINTINLDISNTETELEMVKFVSKKSGVGIETVTECR